MVDVYQCPAGCGRARKAGRLLCGPCWSEVPKVLQREVYRTWRAYKASNPRTHPRFPEKSREYRDARDAAIGSIR